MNHLRKVVEKFSEVIVVKTFQEKTLPLKDTDHQHLSNIYWFNTVLADHCFEQHRTMREFDNYISLATMARIQLQNRFNNELLPYHPHPDFKEEHNFLKQHGYMNEAGVVTLNGEQIGVLL